jgi:hypothetical protein
LVALVLYGGKVVFDENFSSGSSSKPQAPSSSKRSQLELERRSRVVSAHPLSIHAAQTRTVKGLSATYSAEYTERGCSGNSTYDLLFADGRVTGKGWDADGDFQIDGGVYDPLTGAVAWGEWTKSSGLYSEVMLVWDAEEYVGSYRSNMGMSGTLVLKFRTSNVGTQV